MFLWRSPKLKFHWKLNQDFFFFSLPTANLINLADMQFDFNSRRGILTFGECFAPGLLL